MKVDCVRYTDPGTRTENEDTIGFFVKKDDFCAVVADGLGGHGKGDLASQTVVNAVRDYFNDHDWNDDYMGDMFVHCNDVLLAAQKKAGELSGMKTTLVVAIKHGENLTWCHCGDSRFYLFHGMKLVTRTMDHSIPQMLVLSGEIKEKQIRNHPDRSRLLKCLGIHWEKPLYEVGQTRKLTKGDTIIMCSDGFWEYILEREMSFINIMVKDPQVKLDRMRSRVEKRGKNKKMDNNSAVLIGIE